MFLQLPSGCPEDDVIPAFSDAEEGNKINKCQ